MQQNKDRKLDEQKILKDLWLDQLEVKLISCHK